MRTSLYADGAWRPSREALAILLASSNVLGRSQVSPPTFIRARSLLLGVLTSTLDLSSKICFPVIYLGLLLSVWQLKEVNFQFLERKVAAKLVLWEGNNITAIWRTALVKFVLSSQAVYYMTLLVVPPSTLRNTNMLERAFLWSVWTRLPG